ncbi:MAG: hypothetical protein ACI8RU_001769, partial [Zhongshania aliphaticivorans]
AKQNELNAKPAKTAAIFFMVFSLIITNFK